jgi:polyisoprenoid-binding protein YceI
MTVVSTPVSPPRDRRSALQRHWKKIVGAVAALAVLVVAGSFIYAKVINDSPDKLDAGDLTDALSETAPAATTAAPGAVDTAASPRATAADGSTPRADTAVLPSLTDAAPVAGDGSAQTTSPAASDATAVDGVWNATEDSTLRYRVTESINGFDTEGVGETNRITGTLTLAGSAATAADFTVDMTSFTSNESRRDNQFNGRIMSVTEFPSSRFVLTSPIEFGAVPSTGETLTATATGELTLRGVTNPVTFDVTATLENGKVGVFGNIPVLFADYGIPNPSFGTITTEDNGLLEFILVFERA